jgi:type I restriction enzyme S subunit
MTVFPLKTLQSLTKPRQERISPQAVPDEPYVGMECVESHSGQLIRLERCANYKSTGFRFQRGDVLYGRLRPYLNKVWRADQSGICSSEFIVFPASEKIAGEYLAHLLRDSKFLEFACDLNRGDRPRISFGQFANFEFPVPILDEQRRIAKQLDRIASRLDDTKARLDTIPATLKRFRMAVLAAACSGRLTADWRSAHGSEVADRLLEKIFDVRIAAATRESDRRKLKEFLEAFPASPWDGMDLPQSWVATCIGAIGQVCNGSTPSRKVADFWAGEIPWVSSGEVQNHRIASTRERISQVGYNNSSVRMLPAGTVLIAMIGEGKTRGQSAILDIEACINQNIAAVVIDHGFVEPGYLWYWFQGQYEANRQAGSGSGPQALNCQHVRELPFNLPPLAEQSEIVRRVEALLKQADAIAVRYQKARTFVDKLMPAALAKAFRGELL